MKRRIYLIAALALINIVIMKYNEFKAEGKTSRWAMTGNGAVAADSLLPPSGR